MRHVKPICPPSFYFVQWLNCATESARKLNREERGEHGDFLFSYVVSVCYAVEINHEERGDFLFFSVVSVRSAVKINRE